MGLAPEDSPIARVAWLRVYRHLALQRVPADGRACRLAMALIHLMKLLFEDFKLVTCPPLAAVCGPQGFAGDR